ncbi:MAG: hypothetical protein HQL37_15820, partial [Alphaproteobacteria bacterium]|nr:hypothetical protein [Alphaproteobacteria bacterium]
EPAWDTEHAPDVRIFNRVGFRKQDSEGNWTYYVLPEQWKAVVCKGFDAGMVAEKLRELGALDCDKGKATKNVRIPGMGKRRVYALTARILGSDDHE